MTTNSFNPVNEIDARGPRFAAAITSLVFLVVLATEYLPLLIWQTAVLQSERLPVQPQLLMPGYFALLFNLD